MGPLTEDKGSWKTIFNGTPSLIENNLYLKTTFIEGQTIMEETLQWKTIFDFLRDCLKKPGKQVFH